MTISPISTPRFSGPSNTSPAPAMPKVGVEVLPPIIVDEQPMSMPKVGEEVLPPIQAEEKPSFVEYIKQMIQNVFESLKKLIPGTK